METASVYKTEGKTCLEWPEPFEWEEPLEWGETWDLVELSQNILADDQIEAAIWLLYNREKAMQLHGWQEALNTAPSAEHYRNTYLWDSGFCAIMLAQAGELALEAANYLDARLNKLQASENRRSVKAAIDELRQKSEEFLRAAVTESFWVVNGQKENGMIPNLQFAKGRPRWFDVEWWFSADTVNRSSNYTQPPVLALSTLATYKALRKADAAAAEDYLEGMRPYLDRFFNFFYEHRRNSSQDPLIGVVDPHETGMDSLVQWDYYKTSRPEDKGPDHDEEELFRTRIIDGGYAVLMQFERWAAAGLDQAKQREIFWADDVAFNSICFHNLQVMAWLSRQAGNDVRAEEYDRRLAELQTAMLSKLWITDKNTVRQPGFYSLNADGEPIDKITVSNLFILLLPKLSEEQLNNVLDIMDEHFNVPYPLPSCSIKDPAFDPHNFEKDRLWRGPVWLNANWYIVEFGLLMQSRRTDISRGLRNRCLDWAERITEKSNELLDINHQTEVSARRALGGLVITRMLKGGQADRYRQYITGAREHYDPLDGGGQRDRVINFAWSWLPRFMSRRQKTKRPPEHGP